MNINLHLEHPEGGCKKCSEEKKRHCVMVHALIVGSAVPALDGSFDSKMFVLNMMEKISEIMGLKEEFQKNMLSIIEATLPDKHEGSVH